MVSKLLFNSFSEEMLQLRDLAANMGIDFVPGPGGNDPLELVRQLRKS